MKKYAVLKQADGGERTLNDVLDDLTRHTTIYYMGDVKRMASWIEEARAIGEKIQADNARLRELLDSTLAQLHATQEARDEWAARREAIALRCDKQWMDLLASMKETERWKAVAQMIISRMRINTLQRRRIKIAVDDGNLDNAERLVGMLGERREP